MKIGFGNFFSAAPMKTGQKYSIIFGDGVIDLSEIAAPDRPQRLKVSVIFGNGVLEVDPQIPLRIIGHAAFADLRLPDARNVSFGDLTYQTAAYVPGEPATEVEATTVFGALKIVTKERGAKTDPLPPLSALETPAH